MDTLKDLYLVFMHIDLMKLYEHLQAIGLSVLTAIGVVVLIATVIQKLCQVLIDAIDSKEIDGVLGVVLEKSKKVATLGINILHIFPSWSDSPKTALLKKRIEELESVGKDKGQ